MKLKDYFIFFRVKNLLMLFAIQYLLKYVFFKKFDLTLTLDDFHFGILSVATIFIALAGYLINDIHDIKSDSINKPNKAYVGKKISIKKADYLFLFFNFTGLLLGYYLSYSIDKISFFSIFIIASLLSYLYSFKLKKKLIVKNLIVSFLVFLSVLIVGLFDIVPATSEYNNQDQLVVFNLVFKISVFAFLLTLLREIVKDLADVEGDKLDNIKSLPIVLGANTTKIILILLGIITLCFVGYFSINLFTELQFVFYFLMIFIFLPLLYFIIRIKKCSTKSAYSKLSSLLKIIMLLGFLIVFLF